MTKSHHPPENGATAAVTPNATPADHIQAAMGAELFRALVDSVSEYAIFFLDTSGRVASWNLGAELITGYPSEEVMGRHFSCLYTDSDKQSDHPAEELRVALSAGRFEEHGWRVRRDGSQFWANVVITPAFDAARRHIGYAKVTRDETARKQSVDALRQSADDLETRVAARAADLECLNTRLAASEERFRFLADAMPQIVWTSTPDGNLDYYNQRWFDYTGMTLEERQGWGWKPVLHPGDLQNCIDLWTQAYTSGEPYNVEYRFLRASDNNYRWHLGRALPMKNADGQIVMWAGTCTDIDDFKQSEAALRRSHTELKTRVAERTAELEQEQQFSNAVLDSMHAAVFACDEAGRLIVRNRQADLYSRVSKEETKPELWSEDYGTHRPNGGGPMPMNELPLYRALQGETITNFELLLVPQSDLPSRTVLVSGQPMVDPLGEKRGAVVVCYDITDRKMIEEELRHSEVRFKTAFDSAPIGMALVNTDGLFLRVNTALCHIVGYSERELLDLDFQTITHPDDLEAVLDYMRRMLSGDIHYYEMEKRYIGKGGRVIWILQSVSLVYDTEDKPSYFIAQIQDISGRKEAEAKVLVQADKLARSNLELEQFAYIASHDLQEPLRKVQTFGQRLQAKYGNELGEQGNDYIDRMQNAAVRMQQLVQDLLTLSRVSTQVQPFVEVDLSAIAREVVSDMEATIESAGGSVEIGPMPTIEGNPLQMRQLFQNLIGNALKYQKRDAIPSIRVNASSQRSTWRIDFSDNGIGFDEAYADRIFTPFQRLHTREEYEGTGMGLAICRKIVEHHHGTITGTGTLGEGSIFTIVLPAVGI